ncbi:SulP family sulfate permease [Pullulanibacillus pueri]|uniref:Putative sulfate transporter YbaR n=1 Tax=Pullulanibacillus pueri TaxID=1437324 RepID=A0A8J2ZXG5_9BACL|nr:SulP family inorganic anion transporter [Pullulanibacillus pueri]MBM7681763.1 SulP family sulfate permease [Pullulanibacillus pueri]GGH84170.1 putative sulfate transporter YbaR [Pullulanibacillus pueri]
MNVQTIKDNWFSNIKNDVLAGMTVSFALIPEAIAFSIAAGVDPMVGLYASFIIPVILSFFGGRPGMISAATASVAMLVGVLVSKYGVEYLFAASILAGIIQMIFGALKFGRFITFVPQSVMIGFVNALAIMIFMAQLVHFHGASWIMYAMVAGTLAIIYILPRFTKAAPAALIAIIIMTIIEYATGIDVKTVGDLGHMSSHLPSFHLPSVPLSLHMLAVIFPYSLSMAVVGSLETLMTSTVVDEYTETKSDKNKEVRGLGLANFVTGFFGGMAGCAMIGQSVINVQSGGRKRLSTFIAGAFLMVLIVVLSPVVKNVPMGALVGVMFMVSINTFDWKSLINLRKMPVAEAITMILTVIIVVFTSNLAIGVGVGVVISALIFGWRIARIHTSVGVNEEGIKTYTVSGQMFFGTMSHFVETFEVRNDPNTIIINFEHSHIWDHSAVTGISKVIEKYKAHNKSVKIVGLNDESKNVMNKIGLGTSGH